MNHMKKILFGLAVVAGLALLGANTASADCTATGAGLGVVAQSYALRSEGTTEQSGVINLGCTAVQNAPSFISVVVSGVKVDPAAGTTAGVTATAFAPFAYAAAPTWSNSCTGSGLPATANNTAYFQCPALGFGTAIAAGDVAPSVSTSSSSAVFSFTPPAAAGTFTITGIRLNVAAANLTAGSVVTATLVTSGGIGSKSNSSIVLGIVSPTLASSSAFQTNPLSIFSCAPGKIPIGQPTQVTTGNPDLTGGSTLTATLNEGTLGIWQTQAGIVAGAAGFPADTAATQGIRFRLYITGVPTGMVAYAPELVTDTSVGGGGVLQLVTGQSTDGSGGAQIGATAAATNFDLITPTSGAISVVYEVNVATAATVYGIYPIKVALLGTSPIASGAITGAISPAPVGPPTVNASIPQFGAGVGHTIANITACASYLLFPWVVNTNDGNYNTGMAIANTTADVPDIGTTGQTGNVTAYFFPFDGSASFSQSLGTGVKPGQTVTFVVGSLNKAFTGYVIVECSFSLAHGFAFIDNPIAGQNGFAEGVLAIGLTNPRIGAVAGAFEINGH